MRASSFPHSRTQNISLCALDGLNERRKCCKTGSTSTATTSLNSFPRLTEKRAPKEVQKAKGRPGLEAGNKQGNIGARGSRVLESIELPFESGIFRSSIGASVGFRVQAFGLGVQGMGILESGGCARLQEFRFQSGLGFGGFGFGVMPED